MSKSKKDKAVALRYNMEEDAAPVVIASGYGEVARSIIQVAEQKGIPVFRDDSAASLLCMLEVGSGIPPQLYEVIAAIYAQLLKTASEIKNKNAGTREDALEQRARRLASRTKELEARRAPLQARTEED